MKTKILKIVSICLIFILSFSIVVFAYTDTSGKDWSVYAKTIDDYYLTAKDFKLYYNKVDKYYYYVYTSPKILSVDGYGLNLKIMANGIQDNTNPTIDFYFENSLKTKYVRPSYYITNTNSNGVDNFKEFKNLSTACNANVYDSENVLKPFLSLGWNTFGVVSKNDYISFEGKNFCSQLRLDDGDDLWSNYADGEFYFTVKFKCNNTDFLSNVKNDLENKLSGWNIDKDGKLTNNSTTYGQLVDYDTSAPTSKKYKYKRNDGTIAEKEYSSFIMNTDNSITYYNTDNSTTTITTNTNNTTTTDNSITITETDLSTNTTIINNYYYAPTTPPPDVSGGDSGGNTGGSIWDRFLNAIASIVKRITEFLGTLITGILEGLVTIIDNVFALFNKILSIRSNFTDFIGNFITFLPPEIMTILTAGIGVAILVAVLRMLKR